MPWTWQTILLVLEKLVIGLLPNCKEMENILADSSEQGSVPSFGTQAACTKATGDGEAEATGDGESDTDGDGETEA